jgi:hypothetical protein
MVNKRQTVAGILVPRRSRARRVLDDLHCGREAYYVQLQVIGATGTAATVYRKIQDGEGEMFRTTHHDYLDHNRLCIDLYHALTEALIRALECGLIAQRCMYRPRDRGRHATIDFRFRSSSAVQGRCLSAAAIRAAVLRHTMEPMHAIVSCICLHRQSSGTLATAKPNARVACQG